jgi:NAD(P)-dependent dehydrogenase (short-subunit alcohol dehydrogenase family)
MPLTTTTAGGFMSAEHTRRRFIKNTGIIALSPLLINSLQAQTAKTPLNSFVKTSTAEEVTAGLNLSGKTFLVTGANSGLGFETSRVLALRGGHVIAVARSMEKAQEACAKIKGKTTPIACELADFNSVVACSKAVQALGTPIDGLICNAGIMQLPELEQVYGLEKQFVVNYLGHFILTQRLLPQVQAAPQGRLIMLSSGYYTKAPVGGIEFDNLSGEKNYDGLTAYGQSKLAMALFSNELARRYKDTTVTSNAVLPGVINTNLGRHMSTFMQVAANLIGWTFMKSVEAGAATSCYVATNPALAKTTGEIFDNCNPFTPEGTNLSDPALAAKLWDVSMELTKQYLT